jgi:hypothetical protein
VLRAEASLLRFFFFRHEVVSELIYLSTFMFVCLFDGV